MVQKKNLVFVDAINYECKDSCTTNFESGEENLNELASYIESPTELNCECLTIHNSVFVGIHINCTVNFPN